MLGRLTSLLLSVEALALVVPDVALPFFGQGRGQEVTMRLLRLFRQPPASQAQISASHMIRGHNRRHRRSVERCLGVGTCRASLHRWGMAQSDVCQCGQRQTMAHIIDDCPQTKFAGGLEALHEAGDDVVHWLQNTATKAFAK